MSIPIAACEAHATSVNTQSTTRPFSATVFSIGCLAYILLNGDYPFNKRQDIIRTTHERLRPCGTTRLWEILRPISSASVGDYVLIHF